MNLEEADKNLARSFQRNIPCQHQFFEVADIGYTLMSTEIWEGKEQIVQHPHQGGKLVMCALCGEQRQLWQDGTLCLSIDGRWEIQK
jgi:hypothetical protein